MKVDQHVLMRLLPAMKRMSMREFSRYAGFDRGNLSRLIRGIGGMRLETLIDLGEKVGFSVIVRDNNGEFEWELKKFSKPKGKKRGRRRKTK